MKSKRVTKMLACVLATSMCTVPVFASTTEPTTVIKADNTDGTVQLDFKKEDINIEVSVPTSAGLRINPLTTQTGQQSTVSSSQIASRDLRIINRTWARVQGTVSTNEGVPVIVTARAQVVGKGEGVKIVYNSTAAGNNVFSTDSDQKNVQMKLQSGTLNNVSGNGTYGGGASATVTELGSRIKFSVSGPNSVSSGDVVTVSDGNAGKGAMAILGQATINAAWKADDLDVGLVYNIKASKSSVTDTQPTITGVTSASIVVPAATLGDAEIASVAIQDPKNDAYGLLTLDFGEDQIKEETTGTTLTIDSGVLEAIRADSDLKGSPQDLLIELDDGRVIVSTLTIS